MKPNKAGDEIQDMQLLFQSEAHPRLGGLEVKLEELLRKCLRIMEEMQSTEIEWVRRFLFPFLSSDPRSGGFELAISLSSLLVDPDLMA